MIKTIDFSKNTDESDFFKDTTVVKLDGGESKPEELKSEPEEPDSESINEGSEGVPEEVSEEEDADEEDADGESVAVSEEESEEGSEEGDGEGSERGSEGGSKEKGLVNLLSKDPLYIVLSQIFKSADGTNLIDILIKINDNLEKLATK
jgi:hypothetical protein